MTQPENLRISWVLSLTMAAFLVVLALPAVVEAYPQPCRFPRQYEGRRFQSSYFEVKDEYVAVDCDRNLIYARNVGGKDENIFNIVDLKSEAMYIFNPGRDCVMTPMRQFEIIDYCETSRSATFTGSATLQGKLREGWVTTNSHNYEQTTVVTRSNSKKSSEGCLPFMYRIRSNRNFLMANTFYDVKSGISDKDALKRLDVDTSGCKFM